MASGSFYGTTSNKYIQPKIVWSSVKNTAGNYSTVTITLYYSRTNSGYTTSGKWSGKIYIDGVEVAEGIGLSLSITQNSNTQALTVTTKVNHNSNGKKDITISATGAIPAASLTSTSISSKVSLDTIARASSPTLAGDDEFGGSITIYTNRHDTSFTHQLYYSFNGGAEVRITTGITDSYTWTIPTSLMNSIPKATSGTIKFRLDTFSGGTNIGSNTISFTVYVPDNVKPIIDSVTLTDDSGAFEKIGAYVQGVSKLGFDISASGAYGSSITSCSTVIDGEGTFTDDNFETNILKSKGSITCTTTVKDSRGRSNSYEQTLTVLEYKPPQLTDLKIYRCNKYGTANKSGAYLGIEYSANIKALNKKNEANYTLKYKKVTEDSWQTENLTALDGVYAIHGAVTVIDADTLSSYDIVLMLEDSFYNESNSNAVTKSGVGSSISVLWSLHNKGFGIGIGKVSEEENLLDIGMPVKFHASIDVPQNVLWSGDYQMTADQRATLSQKVSEQTHGIVLVFSRYDTSTGAAVDKGFTHHFIPKYAIEQHSGNGITHTFFVMDNSYWGYKLLVFTDDAVNGYNNNIESGTQLNTGLKYFNDKFALRYVIGV